MKIEILDNNESRHEEWERLKNLFKETYEIDYCLSKNNFLLKNLKCNILFVHHNNPEANYIINQYKECKLDYKIIVFSGGLQYQKKNDILYINSEDVENAIKNMEANL